jgi:trans-aconitate methyltransferase
LESIFYVGKLSPSFWQASEWGVSAVQDAALGTPQGLQSAVVETVDTRWELQLVGDKPSLRKKTLKQTATADQTTAQQQRHDRTKQTPLNRRADFWEALGVTDSNGNVKRGMQSKYKQCQKFVELTSRLIRQDSRHDIEVMDMGCGRGYLTFALHSWLHQRYGDAVSSRGIDVRPKLVKEMNGIVERLGPTFAGLTFDVGTIESFLLEQETTAPSSSAVKMLIALHACDTATDDALWSGISSNADVLVVAPCCHKQVRPQLDRHAAAVAREHPLADVLRHGIYRERIAETVTDSIRALLLELAGYAVQVFEFVGGEHTSKNVMITAVKTDEKRQPADQKDQLRQRIRSLAALHGIREQKLATWMGESLVVEGGKKKLGAELSVKNMPPLKSGVEQRTD